MWDVTSKDYRSELNAEDVARIMRKHATAGSIILFHDSDFAAPRMLDALPGLLSHFQDEGFQFAAIQ
jgi:peptidoglycan/xylan/chitin deacetylase (PgdA/CDA1 family)